MNASDFSQKFHLDISSFLDINSIKFNFETPFIWTSGWKSPVCYDSGKILSYPEIRKDIKKRMSNIVKEFFPETEVIAGVATAGIPIASLIANNLNLPFIYVRGERKKHGLKKLIEGDLKTGSKVTIIGDYISTGKNILHVLKALQEYNCNVIGTSAIFSYNLKFTQEKFEKLNLPCKPLSSLEQLLPSILEKNIINESQYDIVQNWIKNPETFKN